MHWPMMKATTSAPQTGSTDDGVLIIICAMTTPNTALTISSSRKITTMNRLRVRPLTTRPAMAPIDRPRLRTLAHTADMSCTPAMKMVPHTTQTKAGSQPQMTAMAGPTMGAAPATEVKWCPQSTYLLVGT